MPKSNFPERKSSRKPAYSFRETKKGIQLLKYGKFVKYVLLDKPVKNLV